MGKQAPPSPNYQGAAQQQAQSSAQNVAQQTAQNRPNQTNAFGGSVTWGIGPDGQPTQTQSFGGPLGQATQGLMGQAAANFGTPFSFNGPALTNGDDARNQAITAAYGQATSRLDPQWKQREQQMQTQLANQGLDPSSEAYKNAMGELGRERNDAYSSAMNGAIGQGTEAGNAIFNQSLLGRQNTWNEAMQQRGLPLQELQGLGGLLGQAGFNSAGLADATQYLPAAMAQGNYGLQQWQAQNQANADIAGGAGNLLGAGANLAWLLSDERAKTNVVRLPHEAVPGVPWATFEYRRAPGVQHTGVIAQDMQRVRPELVRVRPDGLLEVDYSFLREAKP